MVSSPAFGRERPVSDLARHHASEWKTVGIASTGYWLTR